jgi:copper chaperone CopZ
MKKTVLACLACLPLLGADKAGPTTVPCRVTGLFRKDRVDDLRAAVAKVPHVRLASVDYESTNATFTFDPAKAFPGARPGDFLRLLDERVRHASGHTLGVKGPGKVPFEKLKRVTIPVAGCRCKACELAAYEAAARVDGVEAATVSFTEGRLDALIDPAKATPAKVEAALKRIGVEVKAR